MHSKPTQIIQSQSIISQTQLGKGTFGRVVKIIKNNKSYAVKHIPRQLIQQHSRQRQLLRQIQILKKLNCRNVVKYISHSKTDREYLIYMQYCEGKNLKQYLLSDYYWNNILHNKMQKYFGIKIGLNILNAVIQIRSHMVSNRDIKLQNIIVNQNQNGTFHAVMVDFSEAKFHICLTKTRVGSQRYMPPEIYFQRPYTDDCDSWTLGLVLYEIFQGVKQELGRVGQICYPFQQLLFLGPFNNKQLYNQLLNNPIIFNKERTPKPIQTIIRGLLRPDPKQRMKPLQAIIILCQHFNQLKPYFLSQSQAYQQQQILHQCLATQKQTLKTKKSLSLLLTKIQHFYKQIFKPIYQTIIRKSITQKNILQFPYKILHKIQSYIQQIIDILKIDKQYLLCKILTDQQFNVQIYKKMLNYKNKIKNYFQSKGWMISHQFQGIQENIRVTIQGVFGQRANQIIEQIQIQLR